MKESDSLKICRQYLNKNLSLIIDRPLNSLHPKHAFKYEASYGFIDGIIAPDGEDLDAYYLGVNKPLKTAKGICVAIIHRLNNDDDKLVVVPEDKKNLSDKEIYSQIYYYNHFRIHTSLKTNPYQFKVYYLLNKTIDKLS